MRLPNLTAHSYYIGLLAALIALFVVPPFFDHDSFVNQLFAIFIFLTFLFSVLVISHSKKLMLVSLILSTPLLLAITQSIFGIGNASISLLYPFSGMAFVLIIIIAMLKDMFSSSEIDLLLIVGAIVLYLLIGQLWGFIYLAIEQFSAGSFTFDLEHTAGLKDQIGIFMYFSIATLTTLGYGDIAPVSPPARSLAAMEAVAGQLYLTVLVARLVGMHIAQKR
ncbi:MAG: two pore domain potassium channel family protein [Hyphomicrobiales bacterium]|nr:two pore domain potassium channel family protein [Hyphomicrobiales bacterium]